jgi:type II secretory pathway component GspD/PulD (secretin)
MTRWFVGAWLVCSGMLTCAADGPRTVSLSVTIASSADAALSLDRDASELLQAVAELEKKQTLAHLTRIKLTALEDQPAQFQFGETTAVIVGRSITGGFGSSRGPDGTPIRSAPMSVPNYQHQQTGTILMVTPRVAENGVLVEVTLEQSRYDKSRPASDDLNAAPPDKPMINVKSTVLVPRDAPVVLGGFDRTTGGVTERTVVLLTASAAGPPVAAAKSNPTTQLKVFSLQRIDATAAQKSLEKLFADKDFTLAIDERSNSVLMKGNAEDLAVVEAILLRLDQVEIDRRK